MSKKREVATEKDNALHISVFAGDAGAGMEGADKDSFAIPFLRVLQKMSPQCEESDPEYIEGAKAGMLFNSVTKRLYSGTDGVIFLPCAYQRRFLHWGPRTGEGAGYKGEHLPEEAAAMRREGVVSEAEGGLLFPGQNGELDRKKCDRLVDTRSHFGILVDGDELHQVVLPLSSTQIKKSKQLMSMLGAARVKGPEGPVQPPTWMNRIKITSVLESNDEGSWHGVRFEADGFINDMTQYEAGKAFHAAIAEGKAKAQFAEEGPEGAGAPEGKF